MTPAVLDANVVASGVLGYRRPESVPGAILRFWFARAFDLVTSAHLIAEIERTLANPYFAARTDPADRATIVTALKEQATVATITVSVVGVATHPEDDLVLATAVSAEAIYLVTGDGKLQALGAYQGVTILSPREFLSVLQERFSRS